MNKKDAKQILLGTVLGASIALFSIVCICKFFVNCEGMVSHASKAPVLEVQSLKQEQGEICNQQQKILDKLKNIERKVQHGRR